MIFQSGQQVAVLNGARKGQSGYVQGDVADAGAIVQVMFSGKDSPNGTIEKFATGDLQATVSSSPSPAL